MRLLKSLSKAGGIIFHKKGDEKSRPLQSGPSQCVFSRQASMESWNCMGTFRPYTRMERIAAPGILFRIRRRKA